MPHATLPDGVRLWFDAEGEGEPLLLVMGQASDHTGWDVVRPDFSARYRTIVYDHRGTGQSDKPDAPPYSTRGFAADAVALLDYLGIERAHAYGISMGGRIAQWLGAAYPQRCGALVLGCTTPGNAHGVPRPPAIDALFHEPDPERRMLGLLETLYTPAWIAANPYVVGGIL